MITFQKLVILDLNHPDLVNRPLGHEIVKKVPAIPLESLKNQILSAEDFSRLEKVVNGIIYNNGSKVKMQTKESTRAIGIPEIGDAVMVFQGTGSPRLKGKIKWISDCGRFAHIIEKIGTHQSSTAMHEIETRDIIKIEREQ